MANPLDLLAYSLRSLAHRKLRAYLTVLGIVIGIAAVVSLVSISDGLYAGVQEQLEAFGPRNAVVVPGDISGFAISGGGYAPPSAGRLFDKDAQRVKSIPGVVDAAKGISVRSLLSFKKNNITISISGVEAQPFNKLMKLDILEGRFLGDNDRHVAVIGADYAQGDIFKNDKMGVGSVFYLGEERIKFRVVGILDPSNSVSGTMIIVPFDDAKELAGDALLEGEVSAIRFAVEEGYDVDAVLSRVEANLAGSRGVRLDEKDFSLITADFILEQVGQIIGVLTAVLGFIISISLLVGGFGVANTMFMTVMEKTKEIGTLKAIGATSKDIMLLIILESALIGFAGGSLGLFAGWIISLIASVFDFKTVITPFLAFFAIAFSMGIGIISGILPAYRASKLSPIAAINK
ncbi:hypothetical protein COU37_04165 [Candidatus Micrarchaeota archaeon CG10_big_fil_rev_8_21_14_0_10_45_29]|nr:MAG: hypothetical protein COU37_04165 [Candidatus Micrarchaeota archaeon CG10_big_fil_rev_8_21_14_0_10_45_29]